MILLYNTWDITVYNNEMSSYLAQRSFVNNIVHRSIGNTPHTYNWEPASVPETGFSYPYNLSPTIEQGITHIASESNNDFWHQQRAVCARIYAPTGTTDFLRQKLTKSNNTKRDEISALKPSSWAINSKGHLEEIQSSLTNSLARQARGFNSGLYDSSWQKQFRHRQRRQQQGLVLVVGVAVFPSIRISTLSLPSLRKFLRATHFRQGPIDDNL